MMDGPKNPTSTKSTTKTSSSENFNFEQNRKIVPTVCKTKNLSD